MQRHTFLRYSTQSVWFVPATLVIFYAMLGLAMPGLAQAEDAAPAGDEAQTATQQQAQNEEQPEVTTASKPRRGNDADLNSAPTNIVIGGQAPYGAFGYGGPGAVPPPGYGARGAFPDGYPFGGRPGTKSYNLNEQQQNSARALRVLMGKAGCQETDTQDAIIEHISQEVIARQPLRETVRKVLRSLRTDKLDEEQRRAILSDLRAAIETDKKRREAAEAALDARIKFSTNARLETMLLLYGILGDGLVPSPIREQFDMGPAKGRTPRLVQPAPVGPPPTMPGMVGLPPIPTTPGSAVAAHIAGTNPVMEAPVPVAPPTTTPVADQR